MLCARNFENKMDSSILLLFIVIAIVHMVLVIFALRDLFTLSQFIIIGKVIWTIFIIFPLVTGPLIYLQFGRGERSWNVKIQEMQQRAIEENKKQIH